MKCNYDTIVVGGGPAGSTTAAILAEKGHDVLIVEKDKFPRYHVGESLMPFCYFTLDRLGLTHKMDEIGFTKKLRLGLQLPGRLQLSSSSSSS